MAGKTRRAKVEKWIAETTFDCVPRSGKRFVLVVRIGEPFTEPAQGKLSACGRCPVSLEPLIPVQSIGGIDQFQALCLAINYIRIALRAFVAEGGRVYFPGSRSPIDPDNPSFLPMMSLDDLRERATRRRKK